MVKTKEAQRWNEGQRSERSLHQRKGATGAEGARGERERHTGAPRRHEVLQAPKRTHAQNALSSPQKRGMQVHSLHNRMSACTSAQKTRAPPASCPRREQCTSHQSPFRLLLISGRSRARQHGSQRGAAHAHSPPQVPGSTTTLRDLQSVTRSIRKKIRKGVGRVIGGGNQQSCASVARPRC